MHVLSRSLIWSAVLVFGLVPIVVSVVPAPIELGRAFEWQSYTPFLAEFYFFAIAICFSAIGTVFETFILRDHVVRAYRKILLVLSILILLELFIVVFWYAAEIGRDLTVRQITQADVQLCLLVLAGLSFQAYILTAVNWYAARDRVSEGEGATPP